MIVEQSNVLKKLQENLETASSRLLIVEEQHKLCTTMLAEKICEDDGTASVLFSRFCTAINEPKEAEKALFCRAFVTCHEKDRTLRPEELFSLNDVPPAGSHGKIAFVRNRYAERAYEHFSNAVIGAKPILVSEFSEACDLVYNSRCSYCILPIESSTGGRLTSFYAMMDRYDLKICAIFELENNDTTESVRYALAGRLLPRPISKSKACMLEFSLTREDASQLSELLSATALLGATPTRVDFLPLEYDHSFYRVFLTLRVSAKDAPALGLYLALSHPNYTPIGFYTI